MINIKKSKFIIILIAMFVAGGAFFFGITKLQLVGGTGYTIVSNSDYKILLDRVGRYSKLELYLSEIENKYYKDVEEEALFESMYRALFETLGDEYSKYLDVEEMETITESNQGHYSGVGVVIMYNDDKECSVVNVLENSPAEKEGLKSGDVIVKVAGKTYESLEGYSSALRGEENTEVTVIYKRNEAEKEISIKRKTLEDISVTGEVMEGNIGVIRIDSFAEPTAAQFKEELLKMEEKQVKGVILDLRFNGGGMVDSAVEIADMLMNEGVVVYKEDKLGEKEYYRTEDGKTFLPVVVLCNEYSASSSEILIAGLKDQGVPIVGNTTFGKGIIQIISATEDGDGYSLTINQFFTPDGKVIHGKGIEPDHKVVLDENSKTDLQMEKAIELIM